MFVQFEPAVLNRLAYKVQTSGIMAQYTFFICLFTTACYVLIYFPILLWRVSRRIVSKQEVRNASTSYLPFFAIIGMLEALTFTIQMRAASQIPGTLLGILGQTILPFSMVASTLVLGTKFRTTQIVGVGTVVSGVLATVSTGNVGGIDTRVLRNAGLFALSFVFLAFAIVMKEVALQGKRPRKVPSLQRMGGVDSDKAPPSTPQKFDVFVVNSFSSLMQMTSTIALLPVLLAVIPTDTSPLAYAAQGCLMMFRAPYMPWLTVVYVVCNVLYNIFGLTLMKQASSTVVLIASVAAVPLVSLAFCLPIPLLSPSPFAWSTVAGLVVVMTGILIYNLPPQSRGDGKRL